MNENLILLNSNMGFGFGLFVVFVLPIIAFISIILFLYGYTNDIKSLTKPIKWFWIIFFAFITFIILLSTIAHFIFDKKTLRKKDIYSSYVIDRKMYTGRNTDWQYNHYRFEITPQDSFKFYITDKNRIIRTYRGKVNFKSGYEYRINIETNLKSVFIDTIPALYRRPFSFYYVMSHTPYGNMFYKKGKWKPID